MVLVGVFWGVVCSNIVSYGYDSYEINDELKWMCFVKM